jgi:iduronate 2-sulfatase
MNPQPLIPLAMIAAAAGPFLSPQAIARPSPRPNVLFIAVDDLRMNLGCFGDATAITPNIDRLASRGTRFARAYAQQAVCNASRTSLLTGCRPDTSKVWNNYVFLRETMPDAITLPEYFKHNGYVTNAFGKIYHNQTTFNDWRSWSEITPATAFKAKPMTRKDPNQRGKRRNATSAVDAPDAEYPDGQVALAAAAEIKRLAKRDAKAPPFFLAVGMQKPHLPFSCPKHYWDLYDPAKIPSIEREAPPANAPQLALHGSMELRDYADMPKKGAFTPEMKARLRHGYYAATSFIDAQIGIVMDALDRGGLAKNTIIVLWGDHGYHLGEHGLWGKTTCYEADTRVPFIIVTPDTRPRGVRTDALVELLDIYPTLVELCGLPPRKELEGRSLAANIGHPNIEGLDGARSQFIRPYIRSRDAIPDYMGYAVRTATYRYVEWRKQGTLKVAARELYAYKGDELFETENIAEHPENADLVKKLAAMLPQRIP